MTAVLTLHDISRSLRLPNGEDLHILSGLDLEVPPESSTAIIGRSGSGKSTLLAVMGLLSAPTSGTVLLEGRDVGRMDDAARARARNRSIGFVFQNYSLVPNWTVLRNCQLPLLHRRGLTGAECRRRALVQLDRLGLADRRHALPAQLSGGEQQRVAIARALVGAPRVLLADEPTGALDEANAELVLNVLLRCLAADHTALVMVTHDREVASRAGRVLELRDGALHPEPLTAGQRP